MDMLTLLTLAATQPRRCCVYGRHLLSESGIYECAECALTWIEERKRKGNPDCSSVLERTHVAVTAPVYAITCASCGNALEWT